MKNEILLHLPAECPWRDTLYWFETINSTNDRAKEMAKSGAPDGTVLVASQQTGGRGRMGRSFHSPAGKGMYLSVILRPGCSAEALMHLTCAVAVAVCRAVEDVTGYRPGIKWINDLVADKQKLGGILTEMSVDPKTGNVDYAIVGIGINCNHKPDDFPPELENIATSLLGVTGRSVNVAALAAATIYSLQKMNDGLLTDKNFVMNIYRQNCITLGQEIVLLRAEEKRYGKAVDTDEDGGLIVRFADGTTETVNSGEVSVRGMYGYV